MRIILATLAVASLTVILAAPASAELRDVQVRVEGEYTTSFDGYVRTDGHPIQASSDSQKRQCDSLNLGHTATAQATATGAAVDAMSSIGETFDGDWYPGYDDYFITRFGPDLQSNEDGEWWGILVNWQFTPVGGCQFPVENDDEVLWVYDAFSSKPFLKLNQTATKAIVGQTYTVNVVSRETGSDTEPSGGAETAYEGATVRAVDGRGQDLAGVANSGVSDGDGEAAVTFSEAGWQRLKARHINDQAGPMLGKQLAIASNSVDVCVVATAAEDCAGDPPSQTPAIPDDTAPVIDIISPVAASTTAEQATLEFSAEDDYGLAPDCDRTTGETIALPLGDTTISVTCDDVFGNSSTETVTVTRAEVVEPTGPTDTGGGTTPPATQPIPPTVETTWTSLATAGFKCAKKCRSVSNTLAPNGKVRRITKGGRAAFRLPAGVPYLQLVGAKKKAKLKVTVGRRSRTISVPAGRKLRELKLWPTRGRGSVSITVVSGTLDVSAVRAG